MGADRSTPASGSEVEEYIGVTGATNRNHAAARIQGLGKASSLLGNLDNGIAEAAIEGEAREQTTATGERQATRLAHGLEVQSAPGFGDPNYAARSTTALRDMVTTNIDPGVVGTVGAAWNNVGNTYATVAQVLGTAVGASESGWTGTAADTARAVLSGMAGWADAAARGAQLAGNRTGMQSEAAQNARNSMPDAIEPPSVDDVRAAMLSSTLDPAVGAARIDQQFQAAQAAHAQAVRVVQSYDANLAAVGDTMPAFVVPPAFGSASGTGGTGVHGGSGGHRITVTPLPRPAGGGDATVPGSTALGPMAGNPAAPGSTVPGLTAPGTVPAGTSARPGRPARRPPPTSPSDSVVPQGSTPQDITIVDDGPPAPAESMNVTDPPPSLAPGAPESGAATGNPFDGSAPTTGGRLTGGPDGAGPSGGGSGTRGGGAEVGEGAGEGDGAVLERVAQQGGSPGALVGPAARGGRGGEDKERRRPSYLTNPDPDQTFGTDELVVPPVIGA